MSRRAGSREKSRSVPGVPRRPGQQPSQDHTRWRKPTLSSVFNDHRRSTNSHPQRQADAARKGATICPHVEGLRSPSAVARPHKRFPLQTPALKM